MSWPKKLSVDKRIISLLSRRTYEDFPKAIREMVSNAYDADATVVKIDISRRKKEIVIEDNGSGMTPDQFEFYLRIAGRQRGKRESPKYGRKRIGQFGVGFLAMFPFAEVVEIESTAEGSETVFTATIPTGRFMREKDDAPEDVEATEVEGFERSDASLRRKHYTRIKLFRTTALVDSYFDEKPEGVSQNSIKSWDGQEKLQWQLQDDLSLDFPPGSIVGKVVGHTDPVGIEVWLDGKKLYRNDPNGQILRKHKGEFEKSGDIRFRFVITTNWKAVHPYEARGLRIRLNNVGIGSRTYFGLNIAGRTFSRLHWLTGEVQILEGLDDALALDRENFTWSKDYEHFEEYFRKVISDQAYEIEDIDLTLKGMEHQLKGGKRSVVAAKKDLIERGLARLERKGFKVVRGPALGKKQAPLSVEREKKEIYIVEQHPALEDVIKIGGVKRKVRYRSWDWRDTEYPACRPHGDGLIEINTDYPLFKSKRYGEVFRKIHILLLLGRERSNSTKAMYTYIMDEMLRFFKGFAG